MESSRVQNLPPPPGVIHCIKAGFDITSAHLTAILLPLVLDVFLWLGPRLRIDRLFNSFKADLQTLWSAGGIPSADIQSIMKWYDSDVPAINLFWLMRTVPIGITSLLFPHETSATPLGNPPDLQVSALNMIGWILLLILVGWIGGGLYYRSIAWLAAPSTTDQPVRISHAILQTILVSILWSMVLMTIGTPVVLFLAILLQFNALLANFAMLILSLVSMWVIVPMFFWPHGIFLKRQNFLTSIVSSVQLARFTLPTSSIFILTVFLLSVGLNYLWRIPPGDSWMTLVGILGHSFVTTALLAGSFVYYRDMNQWLQTLIERLNSSPIKQA